MELSKTQSWEQSLHFKHRLAYLSKALWKSVEQDWQRWLQPHGLNINEHQILWITYQMGTPVLSEIARNGVMHVSTVYNFSKKLEERNLICMVKQQKDRRQTYVHLTEKGKALFLETLDHFDANSHETLQGAMPLKELYGKFPEFAEIATLVRHMYGEDFTDKFKHPLSGYNTTPS
ncbi:MarR family protease production transcriptional regulator HPr [Geomicrobium halophilum]|uniref:MarR family protease production transcriptional regulator HPr n=1 Tax=Geomicrobium halophilum TaxID=549000 RepID=A0A841PQT2_9BACL|nr:HTH-type transcriptional regulator Hpr [Geomicrobium halophilum]MBB6449536.1 MarR family protease production transcriptional regulator HPr [Geomicrobium halophilum]